VGAPVKIVSCTDPTAQIVLGYIKVTPGATVDVTYYARGNAAGYFAGGLDWHQVCIGTGPYYLYDFSAGIGGYAQFKANRKHFMSTPLLGEIDWKFEWVGTTPTVPTDPSRTGYWMIRIYDVVGAAAAYGSQSRYIPDAHWKAGADLALSSDGKTGKIDIFDVVTATGKYNQISMEHIFVSSEYFADQLVDLGAIAPPGPLETLYAIRVWHLTVNVLSEESYCVTIISRTEVVITITHPNGLSIQCKFIVWRVTVIHVEWYVWIRFEWCTYSIRRWGGQNHPY
jgi:hypothetical protein